MSRGEVGLENRTRTRVEGTDVLLLFIYVTNLEPDVGMGWWARGTAQDPVKVS
jgi:hypothetical protein